MHTVAVAFWGAFFGTVSLLLVVALIAFSRSARRVAATGSLSALMSGLYVLVFLGWVPVADPEVLMRLQAHMAAVCAAVLGLFLLWTVGELRDPRRAAHANAVMAALLVTVLVAGWALPPTGALALSTGMEAVVVAICLAASFGSALRGAQFGWAALGGLLCMSVTVAGLTRYAFEPEQVDWPLHAATALAAIAYVTTIAGALWMRYSFLIALRDAMKHGPTFDPVTRLRSRVETDAMVGDAFLQAARDRPLGVVVVSIANLMALEQLHGRSAYNHALFICASRLRRLVPPGAELGRLGEDAFLLLLRNPSGGHQMGDLAHLLAQRLARPVSLGTSRDMKELEDRRTEWVADIGVGVLIAMPDMRPPVAVAGARAMSRTAWSYVSRVAWYDETSRQITELPLAAAGAR
ncbi:GGDEF domain-containing protein [Ramlibacter sp. MMS24-I3-19]|uniref:GGDEF domain-containing protein n=1 Tax=Ramlibacter sp. MMS24-I3-19 TaxID=3416606 RepID=UPI003D07B4E2